MEIVNWTMDIEKLTFRKTQICCLVEVLYYPLAPSKAQNAEIEIQKHGGVLVSGNISRSGILVFLVS